MLIIFQTKPSTLELLLSVNHVLSLSITYLFLNADHLGVCAKNLQLLTTLYYRSELPQPRNYPLM